MNIILTTYDEVIDEYLQSVNDKLEEAGGEFVVSTRNYVKAGDIRCGGTFDDDPVQLCINVGSPLKKWFPILLHEESHFDQWKEDAKVWTDCFQDGIQAENILDAWVTKKKVDLPKSLVRSRINAVREVELDCERRTVAKIRNKNLGKYIDLDGYIRQAAAYVYLHNYMFLYRQWPDPNKMGIAGHKALLDAMPGNLDGKFKTLPKKLIPLFDELMKDDKDGLQGNKEPSGEAPSKETDSTGEGIGVAKTGLPPFDRTVPSGGSPNPNPGNGASDSRTA